MLSVALIYFLFWPFSASLLCCTLLQYRDTVHCSAFEDCITLTYLHSSPRPFSISVLMTHTGRTVTEILTNGTALDFHSTHRGQISYRDYSEAQVRRWKRYLKGQPPSQDVGPHWSDLSTRLYFSLKILTMLLAIPSSLTSEAMGAGKKLKFWSQLN